MILDLSLRILKAKKYLPNFIQKIANHTIIWICPSVFPFINSFAGFAWIVLKLGRKVGGGGKKNLRASVSMATKQLSWYSIKTFLWLRLWSEDNEIWHIQPTGPYELACRK